jgi:hypothetical protein
LKVFPHPFSLSSLRGFMARSRVRRAIGPGLRFLVVFLAALLAVRFVFGTIASDGVGPAFVFALFVLSVAAALLWRATLDVRRVMRRLRT